MSSAGRWVLGLLLLLVGAFAVARTISSDGGSQAGKKDQVQTQTVGSEQAAEAAAAAVSGDVACKKPCVESKELADEAITTAKLAPGSVTLSKLAFDVPNLSELQAEVTARQTAERTLQQALTNAAASAQSADAATLASAKAATDAAVANEAADRKTADDAIKAGLAKEKSARAAGDAGLQSNLDDEIADRAAADTALTTDLNNEIAARSGAISSLRSDLLSTDPTKKFMAVNTIEILDGAVTTAKIHNETITDIDIADNSLTKLSLATGSVETDEILDGTITDADIADNSLTKLSLATGSVETDEILDETITDADIADNSLTELSLATGSVESDEIADETILSGDILDGEVKTADLADASNVALAPTGVTTSKLEDFNVTTSKLANLAVTAAKLIGSDVNNALTGQERAVTAEALADGAVTNRAITDGAVALAKLDTVVATKAQLDTVESNLTTSITGINATLGTIASAGGTINAADNPVDWTRLKGVPSGFSDGVDDDGNAKVNDLKNDLKDNDGVVNEAGDLVSWNKLRDVPADFADGSDEIDGGIAADLSCSACVEDGEIVTVTASKLTGTINVDRLADGSIKGTMLSDLGAPVPDSKIAIGTITGEAAADNSGVPTGNIALKTIGADNLADGAVTVDKLTANATGVLQDVLTDGSLNSDDAAATDLVKTPLTVTGGTHKVLLTGQVLVSCDCTTATAGTVRYQIVRKNTSTSAEDPLFPSYDVDLADGDEQLLPISLIDVAAAGPYEYILRAQVLPALGGGAADVTAPDSVTFTSSVLNAVDLGRS